MTNPIQTANDRFAQGLNCAQSVLSAFAEETGISEEAALKLASPFGGGIARQGQVCGALTGALMALGLHSGSAPQDREETYLLAQKFMEAFRKRHGAILCRELLGYDISTADGLQSAREKKIFDGICPAVVIGTTEMMENFLDETSHGE